MDTKKYFIFSSFLLICYMMLGLVFSQMAFGEDITLAWDANTETDLAGYKIYYTTNAETIPSEGYPPIDIPLTNITDKTAPVARITELVVGGRYYAFTITAYNESGAESAYSNMATHYTAGLPPEFPEPSQPPSIPSTLRQTVDVNINLTINLKTREITNAGL